MNRGLRTYVLWSLVGLSLYWILSLYLHFDDPVRGAFHTRTTHVAANVERLVQGGYSLGTDCYNDDVPNRMYDFPILQNGAAFLSRNLGLEARQSLRISIALILLLTFVAGSWLSGGDLWVPLGLAFWMTTPDVVFYSRNGLPDVLALSLSILGFLILGSCQEPGAGSQEPECPTPMRAGLLAGLAMAVAAMIKAPVAMPFVLFFGLLVLLRRTRASLGRALFVGLAFTMGLLAFRLSYAHVNGTGFTTGSGEDRWYFGTLDQRLTLSSYQYLLRWLFRDGLGALSVLLPFVFWILARRGGSSARSSLLAMVLACSIYYEVFFNLNVIHDYYHLPVAGLLIVGAFSSLRRLSPSRLPVRVLGPMLLCFTVAHLSLTSRVVARLAGAHTSTDSYEAAQWVRQTVSQDTYVIRVLPTRAGDWDPSFHYWSKRPGRNAVSLPEAVRLARKKPRRSPVSIFLPLRIVEKLSPELSTKNWTTRRSEHGWLLFPR